MFDKSHTSSESAVQAGTSKADLIAQTRDMIISCEALAISLDNAGRQIADNLATLRDRDDMSLRQIGKALGKSHTWVKVMLDWRANAFAEACPFAVRSKASREKTKVETRVSSKPTVSTHNPAVVKLGNSQILKSLDGLSQAAQRQIAEAVAGNDEDAQVRAERMKVVHAAAETPKSDTSAPKSVSGDTQQIKKGSAEWLFSEAVYFYKATLSKMDDTTFERAMEMFRARRAERCLKVAA